MRRRFLPLSRLIIAVLLMQTVMAPAHCLAHALAGGFATTICTSEGQRTVHLTAEGDMAPPAQPQADFCAVCHALPTAPVFAVPVLPTPAWIASAPVRHAVSADFLPARARAPPFDPTGPPHRA